MNLKKINLNLLKVFEALYTEKTVTKAAQRLYLSQSALSTALGQLRVIFGDPLFIFKNKQMIPTDFAIEIESQIRKIMLDFEKIFVQQPKFTPSTSTRTFKIGLSEYSQIIFLPYLTKIIREEAEYIKVTAIHFRECAQANPFENSQIDIGIGVSRKLLPSIDSETLFKERFVCIGKKGNTFLTKKFTAEKFNSAPQVIWCSNTFNVQSIIDNYFEQNNIKRNEIICMGDFFSCLLAIKTDDQLISVVAERLAKTVSQHFDFVYKPVPLECPIATVSAFWPKNSNSDPGIRWLLEKMRQTAKRYLTLSD